VLSQTYSRNGGGGLLGWVVVQPTVDEQTIAALPPSGLAMALYGAATCSGAGHWRSSSNGHPYVASSGSGRRKGPEQPNGTMKACMASVGVREALVGFLASLEPLPGGLGLWFLVAGES